MGTASPLVEFKEVPLASSGVSDGFRRRQDFVVLAHDSRVAERVQLPGVGLPKGCWPTAWPTARPRVAEKTTLDVPAVCGSDDMCNVPRPRAKLSQ